jgi:calcium/calmodulin-dependent protein kinase I
VIQDEIGKGKFAVVRKAMNLKTRKMCAVKILDKFKKGNTVENIKKELAICRMMKHPNIVALLDVFDSAEYVFLFMELVSGGELFTKLDKGEKYYTEQHAAKVTYEMASAIKFFHARDIVHCDLKPENILLESSTDPNTSIKFTDFGLAQRVRGNESNLYLKAGTPHYVAPEILLGSGYGKPVDIWAMGVISYILLSGFPPFYSKDPGNDKGVYEVIIKGEYSFPEPWWTTVSKNAKDFVSKCLILDPKQRMTATDALNHPFLLPFTLAASSGAGITSLLPSTTASSTSSSSSSSSSAAAMAALSSKVPVASVVGKFASANAFSSATRSVLADLFVQNNIS